MGESQNSPLTSCVGVVLTEIANGLHGLVSDSANRKAFEDQLRAFRNLRDEFGHALTNAQNAALSDPKLRYEPKPCEDGGEENAGAVQAPKQGYEVERYYVLPTPPKGFWRPRLPFNPDGWLSRFQCQWAGFIHPPAEEPRNRAQMLMCEYALLAAIHDKALDIPACDRLTDPEKDGWVENLWANVSHGGTTGDDIMTLAERIRNIRTAFADVTTDLESRASVDSPNKKTPEKWYWKLYEKTVKAVFDAILDKANRS